MKKKVIIHYKKALIEKKIVTLQLNYQKTTKNEKNIHPIPFYDDFDGHSVNGTAKRVDHP